MSILIHRTWAGNITWYNEPPSEYTLDADADVADLNEMLECRWTLEKSTTCSAYSPGKLIDNGFLLEPHVNEIIATMRIGGGPLIKDYIQKFEIVTNHGSHELRKDWTKRSHRTVEQVCNPIFIKSPDTSYILEEGKEVKLAEKSNMWLNANFKIRMHALYTPEGYRLDFKSLSNENIYLVDSTDEMKVIRLGFSADWPDAKTSNLHEQVLITLKPWSPLKLDTIYYLCVNTFKYLANCKEMEKHRAMCFQTMNPYYPPGVSDSSDGYSSTWRSPMGGEFIYCFRFQIEK